jgi:hypothetical protein
MMPSFFDVISTCQKPASVTSLLNLPLVSIQTFLEGVMVLPDFGQVGGSSRNDSALPSLQAPGPALQNLDVRLRTRSGRFSFLIPLHPTRPHRRHVLAPSRHDFVLAASPTCQSGA